MLIDNGFDLPIEVDKVWPALLDVKRVAPCLPGAAITGQGSDGRFQGVMKVKLGPVRSAFEGTLQITEADEAERRVVLMASARDTSGRGAAAATITSVLEPTASGTHVSFTTELTLAGTAGQFGRAVVEDVSRKLVAEFATRLAAEIEHPAHREAPQSRATAGGAPTPEAEASEPEVLDLTAAGRDVLLRRALPVSVGVLAVLILLFGLRRRERPSSPTLVVNGPFLAIGHRTRGER